MQAVENIMTKEIDDMIDFLLFEKGVNIKANCISEKALILDATDKINQDADKFVHCKFEIKTGDIIEFNERKHIITSQIIKNSNSYCAKLKQCTYNIAFNFDGNIKRFNAFIETKAMDIETNRFMSLAKGTIIVSVQENDNTKNIKLNQRFINTGRAWEVTGIDRSVIGLIRLYCNLTAKHSDDDMVREIVDYYKYKYSISVVNKQPVGVVTGETMQLILVGTDNGATAETLPDLICTSSDEAIATVTNTGLITGITDGETVITCTIAEYSDISVQVNIMVAPTVPDSYSVIISGKSTIKVGGSEYEYTAMIYKNGTVVTDKPVVWSISNSDDSSIARATILSCTNTSCNVIANNNKENIGKTVILKAVLSDDSSVYSEYKIKIISLL